MIEYDVLPGRSIVLEPLAPLHTVDLAEAALSGQSMFEQRRTVHLGSEQEVRDWVRESIAMAREPEAAALPFAIVDIYSGRSVGSTWFVNITPHHRRCEIAWSWLAPHLRGTLVNLEAKFVMLQHALESCDVDRVEFRIDAYDRRSARSLDRLGAVCEGVLRSDFVDREGLVHDTRLYAVTRDDWPRVRASVELRLGGEITRADRQAALRRLEQSAGRASTPRAMVNEFPLPRGA